MNALTKLPSKLASKCNRKRWGEVDAEVFALYGLTGSEINTVMNLPALRLTHRLEILEYFRKSSCGMGLLAGWVRGWAGVAAKRLRRLSRHHRIGSRMVAKTYDLGFGRGACTRGN